MMRRDGLNGAQNTLLYRLFSVVETKPRVKATLARCNSKSAKVVTEFVDSHVCQFASEARQTGRIPAVRIPQTNPGMALLCFLMQIPESQRTFDAISKRPTFPQLALSVYMQAVAREGYSKYCSENYGRGSTAPKPSIRRRVYEDLARDGYPLCRADMSKVPIVGRA